MPDFTVTLIVHDAADLAEAEKIVAGWHVTPGTTLFAITGVVQSSTGPVDVGDDGDVGHAVEVELEKRHEQMEKLAEVERAQEVAIKGTNGDG
jgi:hypothetical protein